MPVHSHVSHSIDVDPYPLTAGTVLKWQGAPHLDLGIESLVDPPDSPGILHPRRPRVPLFDESGLKPLYDLELWTHITGGAGHSHEVWLCRAGPYRVVLKFVDSPYGLACYDGLSTDLDASTYKVSPELKVRREARAYRMLLPAQGSIVPHYYGCWVFTMLDGRDYLGHVIEFIDGIYPHEWMDLERDRLDVDEETRQYSLLRALLDTATEMHKLDIEHEDLRIWNTLVIPPYDRQPVPAIVIFDFNVAKPISVSKELGVPPSSFDMCGLAELLEGSHASDAWDKGLGSLETQQEAQRLWDMSKMAIEEMPDEYKPLRYYQPPALPEQLTALSIA